MIYFFKVRLIIIIPNTPTPENDIVGVYLFHNDSVCGKVVSAQ